MSAAWQRVEGQDPKGGLNAKGRASLRAEGHNIRPPVSKRAVSPVELRRQGSFLVRMGSGPGPLVKPNGEKTRLKLSLEAWNHSGDKASAVVKGRKLLDRYEKQKSKKK